MINKIRGIVYHILAIVWLFIFITYGEIEIAVFAIVFTILGSEANIASLLEKDAENK